MAAPNAGPGSGISPSVEVSTPPTTRLFSAPFGADHLLGDWGGLQPWLRNHGVNLGLAWLTETAGNPVGGRRQGLTTSGQVGLEIDLDWEKIAGLRGLATHTMIVNGNGRSLSQDYIGDDINQVQQIYGSRGNVVARLVYMYAEQELANRRVILAGGWLPVGTYFAASPIYCSFVSVLNCGNPHPLPNYPGEPDWPNATLGGQVRVLPSHDTYVQLGAFDVNPRFGGISGWAWAQPGSTGISVPAEAGWSPSFGRSKLLGHYKVGFDYDSSPYADLFQDGHGAPYALSGADPVMRRSRREYYVLFDQMVHRDGDGLLAGLILFGGYVHADTDVSPISDHVFAGILGTGTFLGRPKDQLGFQWHWINMSQRLTRTQELQDAAAVPLAGGGLGTAYAPQGREQVFEWIYTAAAFRGIALSPDIQYMVRPGATSRIPDALALGVQTSLHF
ncbi:carbohydrate porin [Rhizosaccharibacter radicis]|uniref:Carbohydrate porin n=1 Tax=Rhizosaccharibacter radicis TaxID=2782605 RepID=A0ABT1VTM9_9PROT|nr:carbohydrate porin [Acetobacteraceae bacterium KSS12]